jgi:hypothetical protein
MGVVFVLIARIISYREEFKDQRPKTKDQKPKRLLEIKKWLNPAQTT